MGHSQKIQAVSVIVPESPFVPPALSSVRHCLAALDVEKLMEWWPGTPHVPHRNADKVRAIQRSLDWKRVAQIAAYLLQEEITGTRELIHSCFKDIYEPKKLDKGRQWPPEIPKVISFEKSEYPTFANILLHINGASLTPKSATTAGAGSAQLTFDAADPKLALSVIDGQHRVNGAYFAVFIRNGGLFNNGGAYQIPAEIFLDLDAPGDAPRRQAQIFIDVNFYQKKVDRSLVADLFPTARGRREPLDDTERAQDIGRRLMLDVGPLVGMIQIPGIRYGVRDVVSLATLNSGIEEILPHLDRAHITTLADQVGFIAAVLEAWVNASGRAHDLAKGDELDPENVAYQGRVIVSVLTLVPACIVRIKKMQVSPTSPKAKTELTKYFAQITRNAGLSHNTKFLSKSEYKKKGYLGSGGIGRFRDVLWAATAHKVPPRASAERIAKIAQDARAAAYQSI